MRYDAFVKVCIETFSVNILQVVDFAVIPVFIPSGHKLLTPAIVQPANREY